MNRHERRAEKMDATLDPGYDIFRAGLKRSFPDLSERAVGEAWMRKDTASTHDGPPETWKHIPGTVAVQLIYGKASISSPVSPPNVTAMVGEWAKHLSKVGVADPRAATRDFIVEGLATNRHNDKVGAIVLIHAGLWLAWTNKTGPDFHSRLLRGDVRVWWNITDVQPKVFNFQLGMFDLLADDAATAS